MNIIIIENHMDDEDRNVAHSMNARSYWLAGDIENAEREVALDEGYSGSFAEWLVWAEKAEAERKASHAAHRAFAEMGG